MNPAAPDPAPSAAASKSVLACAAALIAAALAAWSNSFAGPFVFDDRPAILANPTLQSLTAALTPPRDGGTVSGRPLVNLSLALNHALSGTDVWSYHVANLAIHILGGLLLFGLVRRTPGSRDPRAATALGFSAALLWTLHPLQTAAVTYIVQRAESLCALCLLLALYAFARSRKCHVIRDTPLGAQPEKCHVTRDTSPRCAGWLTVSVLACLAGMACKEVMVVAPVIVLLYDRVFAAGTFGAALRARPGYYAALASSWLLLAWLIAPSAGRAGTAGFGGAIAWGDYALTQCAAIVHYLRLAFWPTGLVFDHGTAVETRFAAVGPQALLLAGLVLGTAVASRRRPALGFLGAAFLLILAPSSSVVPIHTQTIAEHRMYLPLAAIAVAASLALQAGLRHRTTFAACLLALPLGVATYQRNRDYHSAVALWSDTVARRPDNPRARNHLGNALAQAGRPADALPHYEAALRLAPGDAEAHNNLGNALTALGRAAEALPHFERAVQLEPDLAPARLNLANALLRAGQAAAAVPHYAAAARSLALDAASRYNHGVALVRTQQFAAAIEEFRAVLRADPTHLGARVNLANTLLVNGRTAEAIAEYEAALRQRPDDPQIQANLRLARSRQ